MTPDEIQLLLQSKPQISAIGHGDSLDLEKSERSAKLKDVLDVLQQYSLSQSNDLDLVAEKLGDGSREGEFVLLCCPSTKPT